MTLKKSTLLVGGVILSSMLLVACNDKETKSENADKVEQPKTEQVSEVKKEQPAPQQTETTAAQTEVDQNLVNFNNTIKIIPDTRHIGTNQEDVEVNAFVYKVENLSDKAIKEVVWFNATTLDNAIIDISIIPAVFENTLAPKGTDTVTLTKALSEFLEPYRPALRDPKANIQVKTIAGKIVFADNSEILVTTSEELEQYLQQAQKANQ